MICLDFEREYHGVHQECDLVQKDQREKDFPRKFLVSRHDLNPVRVYGKNWKSEEPSNRLVILWDGIHSTFDEIVDNAAWLEAMEFVTNEHVLDIRN